MNFSDLFDRVGRPVSVAVGLLAVVSSFAAFVPSLLSFYSHPAGLRLYGSPGSTCTLRVLLTLAEKEVTDFKLVPVDVAKGEHKAPAHLLRQCLAAIWPGTGTSGWPLHDVESRAIGRYLDNKYPDQGTVLFGSSLEDKAKIDTWVEAEHANYNPAISAIVAERVFKPRFGKPTNEERALEMEENFSKVLDVYEQVLSKQKYLAGDRYSFADLSHVPYTYYLTNVANQTEFLIGRPSVASWWDRISSRPASKKVLDTLKQ